MNNTKTVSDIRAAFYDLQRQQANEFEVLVQEVILLNQNKAAEANIASHKVEKAGK